MKCISDLFGEVSIRLYAICAARSENFAVVANSLDKMLNRLTSAISVSRVLSVDVLDSSIA